MDHGDEQDGSRMVNQVEKGSTYVSDQVTNRTLIPENIGIIRAEGPLNSKCAFGLKKVMNFKPEVLLCIQTEFKEMPTDNQLKDAATAYLQNETESNLSARKFIEGREIFPDTLFLMAALKKAWKTHMDLHDADIRTLIFSISIQKAIGNFWKMEEITMEAAEYLFECTEFHFDAADWNEALMTMVQLLNEND